MPALAAALDSFFTENKLPRRGVRLGLGTNRIGVRAFDVDGIDDERQLANAIRFRAHEAVSIPIDEAVLDYHVVSETVDEAGAVSRRILLAAAYRESIDRYVEACRAARIELSGSTSRRLRSCAPSAPRDADSGRRTRRSPRSSSRSGTTARRSRSPTAPSASSRACSNGAAGSSRPRSRSSSGSPRDEAAELKLDARLGADAPDDDDPRARRAREAVERELQKLARELVASLQFYQSQPGSLAISEILVSGGTSSFPASPRSSSG